MSAGEDFVKKIRPVGAALFIILAVLVVIVCITAGTDPIPGYEPPQTQEYYAINLDELEKELTDNVFPELEGVIGSSIEDGKVVVVIKEKTFAVTRSAILRYFDKQLLEFVMEYTFS